jgi:hypothetical protein
MQPTRQRHRVDSVAMDTWISVQVVADAPPDDVQSAIRHALGWFESVERATSRFEPDSELMCLARAPGLPVAVSQLLLESVAFALELARSTDGAFDPTVGGLTDPPTSPSRYLDQVCYGAVAALGSFAATLLGAGQLYLLLGTAVANLWLVARRLVQRRGRYHGERPPSAVSPVATGRGRVQTAVREEEGQTCTSRGRMSVPT